MGNCMVSSSRLDDRKNTRTASVSSRTQSKNSPRHRASVLSPLTLPSQTDGDQILPSPKLKAFTFIDLKIATRNFRQNNLLGEGGFGDVYKGWIDPISLSPSKHRTGMVVAVKKLKSDGFQGHKEWLTEVKYLGQLHHPSLVKLIGYCLMGENRLLVYEYMPKGSLENHLFRQGPQSLSWATRMKVAVSAARGLAFLHDAKSQVIYRDFKTSNVLLDAEFNAKLSDFGLAKAGPTGDNTHVTTQVLGTYGYVAPEYVATGRLTAKSDVYSFGVVLLELLSGRRAVDKSRLGTEEQLVEWAKPFLEDVQKKVFRIMDTKLLGQYPRKAACTVAKVAFQCLNSEPKLRPKMSEVLAILEQLESKKPSQTTGRLHRQTVPVSSPESSLMNSVTSIPSPLPSPKHSPRL